MGVVAFGGMPLVVDIAAAFTVWGTVVVLARCESGFQVGRERARIVRRHFIEILRGWDTLSRRQRGTASGASREK